MDMFAETTNVDYSLSFAEQGKPGVYILENTPPPPGGKHIGRCHLGEKIWKGKEKKGENVKEKRGKCKRKKRKEKERKGKENEERGRKG
jgi:hypothetical protein